MNNLQTSLLAVLPADRYVPLVELATRVQADSVHKLRVVMRSLTQAGHVEVIKAPHIGPDGKTARYKYRLLNKSLALELCAKYPGVWGQLHWSGSEK